ncbi:RagB/SusD family nutrient uptake outer membrane protein [Flavivirga spongiicola]|uniref:RagB/SusD family nutrient uptake outer membrane protein n=1 Tax=Flavivirga spongiicola TaxID=421621 RepID=A0ABU7XZI2_9FLAO|nr:RagB/SusD family nutrient uptake outer membrane protein [Flavivirga sp. MEBiC05379]MDO5980825.1 RagB/SusD family nutrient uptake outer membrane protein [Flavivirga sp. MEBiC05379]
MKVIYKIKTVIFLMVLFLSQSCSIDDVVPINELTDLNVIRDENSAQSVLDGIYTQWRSEFTVANAIFLIEFQGDLILQTAALFGDTGMATNQIPDDNSFIQGYYNTNYKIINNTNWLITKLEAGEAVGISEERKTEMIAEARCQRAMASFDLLRSYGQFYNTSSNFGIVLRDKPAQTLEAAARSSVQESYDFILADLQFAATNAPATVANGGFISRVTANAYLAKVYLYMGDYANAATTANQVIGNGAGYALESAYANIFSGQHLSQEVLFAPFIDGVSQNENMTLLNQINRTRYSPALTQLADDQVAGAGSLFGAGTGFDPRYNYAYADATVGPNSHGKYPYVARDLTGTAGRIGLTKFYLRLAEIYLIEAEALARMGAGVDAGALARLNEIRTRAGVSNETPATKAELLTAIFNEKRLELFSENSESWYDIVRFDRLGDISAASLKPSITNESKLIFPMPRLALASNNLLEPNP